MTWTAAWALGLLACPVVLWGLFVAAARWKNKILAQAGDAVVLARLFDPMSRRMQWVKAIVFLFSLALLALALAGPRWGHEFQEVHRRGVDVIVAMDLSGSMLAEDVKPNRLTQAKRELGLLISTLEGDRVGLVAFAGTSFLQCPLTLDYGAARSLLELLTPDLIPKPGTNIAAAVNTAVDAFAPGPGRGKALVLLTDGEDHSGQLDAAVERAVKEGVRIYTIGFGSPDGEIIPVRDESGNILGYKKDKRGQTVVSKMDVAALQKIAAQTRGAYFPATQGEVEVSKIIDEIGKLEKRDLDSKVFGQGENHYRLPLLLALVLLIIEFLWPETPRHGRKVARDLRALIGGGAVVALFFFSPNHANALGRYPKSTEIAPRLQKNPQDVQAQFELGLALAVENSFAASSEAFEKIAGRSDLPVPLRAAAHYNAGNGHYRLGQLDKAIEKYKETLRLVPSDPDAKHNLEMCLKLAAQQKKQNQSGKGSPKPEDSKPQQGQMSKEDAQRLLEAAAQQEKSAVKKQGKEQEEAVGEDW